MLFRTSQVISRLLLLILFPTGLLASEPVWESLELTGYTDRLSVQQGQTIRFMVSTMEDDYRMDIVRLIHGDRNPKGPGFKEEVVDVPINSWYPGRKQGLKVGSYGIVPDHALLRSEGSLTIQAWIYPTTPQKGEQGIITKWSPDGGGGYGLFVGNNGDLCLWIGDQMGGIDQLCSGAALQASTWYFVAGAYDSEKSTFSLHQNPLKTWPVGNRDITVNRSTSVMSVGTSSVPLLIGASWGSVASLQENDPDHHFNGKIDSPRVFGGALDSDQLEQLSQKISPWEVSQPLIAAWDFSAYISSQQISDISHNGLDGHTVNMPMRAVTGHSWTSNETNFTQAPEEYGAIYFHDDDLSDAGWDVDFEFQIPARLRSGIYAARLRTKDREDYIPFYVRPNKGSVGAKIAYLIPTLNYLAYANYDKNIPGLLSLYDHHSDGSGVVYASRLMPLLDIRPNGRKEVSIEGKLIPRHLEADLYLVDWMEAQGHTYDIITDEDLAEEGSELLAPYKVVVTGSHPEYYTAQMLDGLETYLNGGGRLMYLGGNGFYWVTSQSPDQPHVIEIRRWGGTRGWEAQPGEYHHSTTGELGGLWRFRGRPPQKLVGVGFTAQGWTPDGKGGLNRPYQRQPGSYDPRSAFIFEGIGREEIISDFESLGLGHGAAGDEIDRLDYKLGTPAHALLLATASGFSVAYQHVVEEIGATQRTLTAAGNPLVRSDMVYFEYPNGGAVFSVGSISWFGCLSYNNYQNNVSKITDNVLKRFAADD